MYLRPAERILMPPGPVDGPSAAEVVVGIRRDAASRELVTWALVKVAKAGDRIVAVCVVTADEEAKTAEEELRPVLKVYEGFCHLKQIHLELKISIGKSIRKTLVREAKAFGAVKLILGVARNNLVFGTSYVSVAKFCAKRVPLNCSVLAVNNGKVVFQKDAEQKDTTSSKTLEPSRKSYRRLLINSACGLKSGAHDYDDSMKDDFLSTPISSPLPQSPIVRKESLALVPFNKPTTEHAKSDVLLGWPLLRKRFLGDRNAIVLEKPKISTVEWAMRLPNHYTAMSPIHEALNLKSPHLKSCSDKDSTEGSSNSSTSSGGISSAFEVPKELMLLKEKYSSTYILFSYKELQKITCFFSHDNIIGNGGNSSVYKGLLNGRELAVKILKSCDEVLKDFVSEIEILTSLNNRNIISLVGFCVDEGHLILVYDYLPRGSLEELLHGDKEEKKSFGWAERFKVAIGIAEALEYLHENCSDHPVVHRDVKSSNILLSLDFEPKLSDFGLAFRASSATSNITCNDVAGTFGYLAPEYFMFGKVSDKVDIYAYGVVLLELISGRKPLCTTCPKGQESLVKWACSILQDGKILKIVDPQLSIESHRDLIERMILAASVCTKQAPHSRPHISIVLKLLNGDEDIVRWARSQVGPSEGQEAELGSKIQSYINLALLDVDDDSASVSSNDHPDFLTANTSLEEYLRGRWSRSPSFD